MTLTAGTHTVTVFAREDGMQLAKLELENVRPLATAKSIVNGWFTDSYHLAATVIPACLGNSFHTSSPQALVHLKIIIANF